MPEGRRLRKHAEFVRAQRSGRRVGTRHFTLLVAAQPPAAQARRPARLGLVVSRAVGNAVRRNRVKRLCRECFRQSPDLLPLGVDLIVIARPGSPELAASDVRAEWHGVSRLLRARAADALARSAGLQHAPGDDAGIDTTQSRAPSSKPARS